MKLLLIDNYDSFTYNIVALLHQLSVTTLDIYKNDQITVAEAAQYDKIIISPGPATPHESGNVLAIIDALAPTHPILGICLGHQALGIAFGATLKNLPQPYHGYQTTLNILKPHKIYAKLSSDKPIKVGLYHSWVVDDQQLPASLLVTAISAEGYIMSIKHQVYESHGIQFHPESYMTDMGKELMQGFLK